MPRPFFAAAVALLAMTLLLGGAGADYPLTELAVEGASLVFLAAMAWRKDVRLGGSLLAAAATLALAVPLLQLVPLPPGLWSSLPGRERMVELLRVVGEPLGWRPLTLDPEATWRSMLALMPALALFFAAANLRGGDRVRLALVVVGFGLLGSLLGALQVAGGPELAVVPSAHSGVGTGLFSNRNHQAAFLVVAILLCGAVARIGGPGRLAVSRPIAVAAILLMAAGVVATTSRAGVVLLCVAVPVAFLLLFAIRLRVRSGLAAAALLFVVGLAALQTNAGEQMRERFAGAAADGRLLYWQDIPHAISSYWPFGSGFGTFPTVFQAAERLDFVGDAFVNNAHNDFLELAVEGGLIAVLAILAGLAALTLAVVRGRGWRDRRAAVLRAAAAVAILLLLVHSTVDYPLRMLALAGLFGLLCGLLVKPAEGERGRAPRRLWLRGGLVSAAAVLLIGKAAIVHLAADASSREAASRLAPYSPTAATLLAIEALKTGEARLVEQAALRALRRAPIRPEPVALLAVARQALGEEEQTARLMGIAGAAGWREAITNLWLLNHALASGKPVMAAQRGDALLRQRLFRDEVLAAFGALAADPAGQGALVDRLAANPSWRRALLVESEALEPEVQRALLRAMRGRGMAVREEEAAALVRRLLAGGGAAEAREAWSDLTGAGRRVADAGFERLALRGDEAPLAPFEWRVLPLIGTRVFTEPPGGKAGAALHVAAEAGSVGVVAEQTLVLAPGVYRLSADVRSPGTAFVLGCAGGRELALQGADAPGRVQLGFSITPGCPMQVLGIRLTGGRQDDVRATIDNVEVVPGR